MILRIAVLLLLIVGLGFWQIRRLLRNQQKKEAWLTGTLLGSSALLGALLTARVPIPSPAIPLHTLLAPIGKLLFPH